MNTGAKEHKDPACWRFSGFVLDPGRRSLMDARGDVVRLPARAFDVLLELVRAAGRPVGKDELMEAAWRGRIVEENSLSRAVSTLRQALGDDAAAPRFIATLPGQGYQFVAPIESEAAPPPDSVATRPAPAAAVPADEEPARTVADRRAGSLPAILLAAAVLAVAASAVVLWWTSRPSEPAAPPVMALSNLEILTDFPGSHSSPALSPDGDWLAFTSDASGASQVWIMSLQDRAPRQLTHDVPGARDPAWSPDGQQIAYVIDGWGIGSVSPLSPGPPRRLVEGGGHPAFAPSGQWLVYEWGRQVHRARSDGSDARRIEGVPERRFVHQAALPVVSPNGEEIAYFLAENAVAGDFWRIPASGGEPNRITRDGVPADGASWLPGGGALVVSSTRNGRANLWRVALDGSEPLPLTSGVGDDTRPIVSPDGEWVVYVHQQTRWQLVSSDPRTGEHEVLLERRDSIHLPAVSPDGRGAAWFSADPTRAELFTIDLDGRTVKRVGDDPARWPSVPSWSGDGRSIYYQDFATLDLRRVDTDGRNDVLAAAGMHWRNGKLWLSFQPGGDRYVFQEREPESDRVRTVARSLSGEPDIVFDSPGLSMPSWSRDGTRVIGVDSDDALWQCRLVDRRCEPVYVAGEPVHGAQPRWSRDGERIYLRRRTEDNTRFTLWVHDPAAGTLEQVLEIGPVEPNSQTYDVAAGDRIIWARMQTDDSKIWRGRLP